MIFYYIKAFMSYLFNFGPHKEHVKEMHKEKFWIRDSLLQQEFEIQTKNGNIPVLQIPRHDCLQRTGIITFINDNQNYILIDGKFHYDTTGCSVTFQLNEKVVYLCYKDSKDSLVVVQIQQNDGEHWGHVELDGDEKGFSPFKHVIIGEVKSLSDRIVIMKESGLKFCLDKVAATFVPTQGDLLELLCKVKCDKNNPVDIALNKVVKVVSFRPLRSKDLSATITKWNGEEGICDDQIFLNKHCIINGGQIQVGAKALIEAVEGNQGSCPKTVKKISISEKPTTQEPIPEVEDTVDIEQKSLEMRKLEKTLHNPPIDSPKVNGNNFENGYCERKVKGVMNNIRNGARKSIVPGVPLKKTPNIAVKLGSYRIPDQMWSVGLDDNCQRPYIPCLMDDLNINNYSDKWHNLLFLEETHQAKLMKKVYNVKPAYLVKHEEYLGLQVKNLAERRPSLFLGDRVIVQDFWEKEATAYEGFVHAIRGDLVLLKFHPRFHETYRGSDLSIEFRFSRTQMRKAHQAVNLAVTALGPDVLFPSRLITRPPQVPLEDLSAIKWVNPSLNTRQKEAVTNILIGESRPMPYCIFGPPGTGKTVTVVETILQILTCIPDSRILVATPSNSAANLITERLLEYRELFSSSIIRLIANYLLNSESIPETIKPFCATLNIARENASRPTHVVHNNGISMDVPASHVKKQRVTVGTCRGLGSLALMELPKGHYTHIIVDEAGQAMEPEQMIPLTFLNKERGQIVVAGDPKQLGPVVLSKYCSDLGMDISYLSRILDSFAYQKDFAAFENGYNNKLITQLTDNYRSLEEVFTLPNKIFYDATLVAKVDRTTPFIQKTIDVVSEIFEVNEDIKTGGVFVLGVVGENARDMDNHSWFNLEEVSTVALTLRKLYMKNISPDDIGIITPYRAQTKHLHRVLDNMHLDRPKIGTVEEFQGQERRIIILTTVRSSEALLEKDRNHSLGFVKCPKRFNVALTRAQVAVIMVCDPHILSTDPLWAQVINKALKENKYTGCTFSPVTVTAMGN